MAAAVEKRRSADERGNSGGARAGVCGGAGVSCCVMRQDVSVPEVERVALLDSAGRVLAEEVRADRDQPPFDRATRDGFAVRAAEWTAGRRLQVVGQVRAGEAWPGGLD